MDVIWIQDGNEATSNKSKIAGIMLPPAGANITDRRKSESNVSRWLAHSKPCTIPLSLGMTYAKP